MPEGMWGLVKIIVLQMVYSLLVVDIAAAFIASCVSFIIYEDYFTVAMIFGLLILETIILHFKETYVIYDIWGMWKDDIESKIQWWSRFFF